VSGIVVGNAIHELNHQLENDGLARDSVIEAKPNTQRFIMP
jgi:hypothetical protein